jgi:hypothetical protein
VVVGQVAMREVRRNASLLTARASTLRAALPAMVDALGEAGAHTPPCL